MNIKLSSSKQSRHIEAPGSKSIFQRAALLAGINSKKSILYGYTQSDDNLNMLKSLEKLGMKYRIEGSKVFVTPIPKDKDFELDFNIGEAGFGIRSLIPYCAALGGTFTLNGEGSLLSRPVGFFDKKLSNNLLRINSTNDRLPIHIQGKWKGGKLSIDKFESSQYLTGLMIASLATKKGMDLDYNELKSSSYIEITCDVLSSVGVNYEWENGSMKIPGQELSFDEYRTEGDWSGASFWVGIGATVNQIELSNLHEKSSQGDKAILEVAKKVGAEINVEEEHITIKPGAKKAFEFDADNCPDLFPPIAAIAACSEGISVIHGTNRLATKESDRSMTVVNALKSVGIKAWVEDNKMMIEGGPISEGTIESYGDHRIAMMAGMLHLMSGKDITVLGAECVAKSYPNYWDYFNFSVV